MKKLWIALIAALVLIPFCMWWFSPEKTIMRRTQHLLEVLSLKEGTGGPLRQAKVFSMNALLAPEVELVMPAIADANGTFDKEEMESAFSWICNNAKQSRFHITTFRNVLINGDTATVDFLAEGFLDLGSSRPADGIFEVSIVWKKSGDGWRYDKVTWEKP